MSSTVSPTRREAARKLVALLSDTDSQSGLPRTAETPLNGYVAALDCGSQ